MEASFIDRLLRCADCHGEFIFTAGEQLFFHEKQFKNDPKRCKPCKSRRSGLVAAAKGEGPAAAGLSRTETRTMCSECGVETTVPFKPTQGRPVLCRMCFQGKNRMASQAIATPVPAPRPIPAMATSAAGVPSAATISALTLISTNQDGATMSAASALVAASSMVTASAGSSVSSAADLASISGVGAPAEVVAELRQQEVLAAVSAASVAANSVGALGEVPEA